MSEYIFEGVILPEGDAKGEGMLVKREKIVRCRDCTHFGCEDGLCDRVGSFPEWHACVEPEGFCKWGERRES